MSRYSNFFDNPLMLGFDHIEQLMEEIARSSSSGYPPYNIEQIGRNNLRITHAVAGFSEDEQAVELEERQLLISGDQTDHQDDDVERTYLHRGIAARRFRRAFALSDEIEVEGAHLDNGLLHIDLFRVLPERNVKQIHIQTAAKHNQTVSIDDNKEKV